MKHLLSVTLLAFSCHAFADCRPSVSVEGVISINSCAAEMACISGAEAVYQYSEKVIGNDDPTVLNISLHASPWRFYDSDMRIITVEEVAEMARPLIARGVKRIALIASWTAVAPDKEGKSLRQKLSETLSGFPVSGMNGFLWIAKDGSTRTTRQAFTVRQGRGPYRIALGEEVMVSLVAGWPAEDEDIFLKERNADGIMRAGAGWDILFLCPEKALQAFEAAARLSHSVAAYNAALIRLERKNIGDLDAAKELLSQAAIAGDKKAQARLQALRDKGR